MAESTLSQMLVMSLSHGPVTLTNVHISTSGMPAVTKLRQKILLWEIIMGHLPLSAAGFIFTWSHDINKSIYLNFWRGYGHQIWTKRRFLGRDFSWQRKVLKFRIIEELRGPTFDTRYICSGGVQHGILPFIRLLHDPAKYSKRKSMNASILQKLLRQSSVFNVILHWHKACCICVWKSLYCGWAAHKILIFFLLGKFFRKCANLFDRLTWQTDNTKCVKEVSK